MLVEKIKAKCNVNITAKHGTTLEITKEEHLTLKGDCIIAVSADRALPELSEKFKKALRNPSAKIEIVIHCSNLTEKVIACGHPDLTLKHPTDMVVRKSTFICDRTLAVKADKASIDLDRALVDRLRKGEDIEIELKIY
jgi:hypothetical protein